MSGPFSRTTLIALVAGTLVSIAVAGAITVLGDDLAEKQSAGADSYSHSAIGHRGLVKLLERLDIPVVVSRSESSIDKGLLVIAEPIVTDAESRKRLERLFTYSGNVLVVLPKWHGFAAPGKPWIESATYVPDPEVDDILLAIDYDTRSSHVVRDAPPSEWIAVDDNVPALPHLSAPQTLRSTTIGRAIGDRDGNILLGKRGRALHDVLVLSDPDVLNNHGLRNPDNARFVVGLIEGLRDGGPVVIDETMHGYAREPSVVRTLFSFPLIVVTLQTLACAMLVVWAAMIRFGPRRPAPPPIASGKDFLIRNTAALLHYGGHHADAVRRYLQLTVSEVRHALHAPASASTEWLERVRESRGGTVSLVELEAAAAAADGQPRNVVALADRIYRWRMEMTHGIDRGS